MKDTLNYLFEGNSLSQQEAQNILTSIAQGQFSEAEVASFLTVFRMRKIKPEELTGFRQALIDLCVSIDLSDYNTIDVCGTGGDGKNTFNISTLSAFVIAGAGIKVAKHGNYGLSSASGSSNMFEHFGYRFSTDEDKLKKEIETAGICYFHAPMFHPALKNVGPIRRALKVKTLFNMMGPIVNPSSPKNQLVGVFDMEIMDLYHQVFRNSGQNFMIVHSLDGYDEVSLTSETRYISNQTEDNLSSKDFGFNELKPEELFGGNTIEEAAKIFKNILEGNGTDAQNKVVIANSALGIKCVYPEKPLEECVSEATDSLKGGNALNTFKILMD